MLMEVGVSRYDAVTSKNLGSRVSRWSRGRSQGCEEEAALRAGRGEEGVARFPYCASRGRVTL
jgi:hypothetical protein